MSSAARLIPASPTNLRPWVLQALSGGWLLRSELHAAVHKLALREGFEASNMAALKKALSKLKANGAVSNPRKDCWSWPANKAQLAVVEKPEPLRLGKRMLQVEMEIGTGAEYVYVMQFSDHIKTAGGRGEKYWKCKVGWSKNAAERLLTSVSTIYISNTPQIGLLIKCADARQLEKVIHAALRITGRAVQESAGNEWFYTHPNDVLEFYKAWLSALKPFNGFELAERSEAGRSDANGIVD